MPLPTRPPECGMMRSPLVRMAATTATLVPCQSSLRLPNLQWAWNRSPWVVVGRNGAATLCQGEAPPCHSKRPTGAWASGHSHAHSHARQPQGCWEPVRVVEMVQ